MTLQFFSDTSIVVNLGRKGFLYVFLDILSSLILLFYEWNMFFVKQSGISQQWQVNWI